jgi:hypothetical protein
MDVSDRAFPLFPRTLLVFLSLFNLHKDIMHYVSGAGLIGVNAVMFPH